MSSDSEEKEHKQRKKRQTTKIVCFHCKKDFTKNKTTEHYNELYKESTNGSHILVQVTDEKKAKNSKYFLFFLMKTTATLKDLDSQLKNYWMECCGHMSQFGDFGDEQTSFSTKISDLENKSFPYLYDFGSTTSVMVSFGKKITCDATESIKLIGRNAAYDYECSCKNPATKLNNEYEFMCEECNGDNEYGYDVCNSPRMGKLSYK
jgi:hypothetical protein